MIASCIILAALVSSDAKMFFSGGEWLPDEVPNRAIYDMAEPAGKELRVTTNVQAAVVSCYSGLIERALYPGAGYELETLLRDAASRRTSNLNYGDWGRALNHLRYAEERRIGSVRILDDLSPIRETLRYAVSRTKWGTTRWGSTQWPISDEIPTWDWTDKDMLRFFGVDAFANAWIEFACCTNDGIWKLEGEVNHSTVDDIFASFRWLGDDYDFEFDLDLRNAVRTNPPPVSCYDIIERRIGTNAVQFANESRRLLYHKLGAYEAAIGAMDRTFDGLINTRPFYYYDLGYTHIKSTSVPYHPVSAKIDFTARTISFIRERTPLWIDDEILTITTNESTYGTISDPLFSCAGDLPSPVLEISVESPILVTQDVIEEMLTGYDVGDRMMVMSVAVLDGMLKLNWLYDGEMGDGVQWIIELPNGEVDCEMSAAIVRRTRVGFTSGLVTNIADVVFQPAPPAWDSHMPKVDLYSSEMRLLATNYCAYLDSNFDKYVYTDITNRGITVQTRFTKSGSTCVSTNTLVSALSAARLRNHADTSNQLRAFLGCGLNDPAALLPIPRPLVTAMRPDLEQIDRIDNLKVEVYINKFYFRKNDDGSFWALYKLKDDGDYIETVITDDIPLVVGVISGSKDLYKQVDLKGRPPCGAEGRFRPFYDIKWEFNNLHEE